MSQSLILATAPHERRLETYEKRIAFFLFWISNGEEPLVFINPNISDFANKLKDGGNLETGTVALDGTMRAIQFSDSRLIHHLTIDGEKLRITLQRKEKFGDFDMEIELFVETIT